MSCQPQLQQRQGGGHHRLTVVTGVTCTAGACAEKSQQNKSMDNKLHVWDQQIRKRKGSSQSGHSAQESKWTFAFISFHKMHLGNCVFGGMDPCAEQANSLLERLNTLCRASHPSRRASHPLARASCLLALCEGVLALHPCAAQANSLCNMPRFLLFEVFISSL